MYLFPCRHFETYSVFFINKFLGLALAITYFSVKQRSELLDLHMYVECGYSISRF